MRRFKVILFSVLSLAIVAVMGIEVFAAVMLRVEIDGAVEYYATDIAAKIFGTYAYNQNETNIETNYLNLSSSQGSSTNDVYYVQGNEQSYSNIGASIGTIEFTDKTDEIEIFVFIKNVGSRYIVPNVNVGITNNVSEGIDLVSNKSTYYFDVSTTQIDPLNAKESSSGASDFISRVRTEISNGEYTHASSTTSIDNQDVYVSRVKIKLKDDIEITGSTQVKSSFTVNISFMADIQYQSNDILSIYQEQDQTSSAWTKFGYNSTLSASATKIEENNLSNLELYLRQADENGNANVSFGKDDYLKTVVYKDIDLVNVDIATGEIIGKLSDPNYKFEWYGRSVTIPSGTTLASGRTLTADETFTVDVYTKYPTMYIRRWVVGNKQWISLSDKEFLGAVKINEYYTGTFEATIFNPDKTVARNAYGIVPRTYVNDLVPLTSGSANYLQTNYGYETYEGSTSSTNQSQMMSWSSNLTKAWENSSLPSEYKKAKGVQGENWTAYVYNMLYLIKYANNNSQSTVGYGNTYTYSLYYASGVTVNSITNETITTGGNDTNTRYESEKGGGTIGVYNSSSKGTATYSENEKGEYVLSSTGYNQAGMNYGYNSTYTYGGDKKGLYANQFLTYNDGEKRYLLDGYVGSDKYTSVFCLGLCNAWGNIWTWVFGEAVISDGTNLFAYINFDNYDYQNSSNSWYFSTNSNGYASNSSLLSGRNYVELSYNLPTSSNYYRYLGTSQIWSSTGIESLIGLPTNSSSTGSSETGLSDYYYCNNTTSYIFGVLRGGSTSDTTYAGAFCFYVNNSLTITYATFGFRPSLIS